MFFLVAVLSTSSAVRKFSKLIKCTAFWQKRRLTFQKVESSGTRSPQSAVLYLVANVSMKLLIAASGLLPHFSMSPSSRNLLKFTCHRLGTCFILFPPLALAGETNWRRRNSCPSFRFVLV